MNVGSRNGGFERSNGPPDDNKQEKSANTETSPASKSAPTVKLPSQGWDTFASKLQKNASIAHQAQFQIDSNARKENPTALPQQSKNSASVSLRARSSQTHLQTSSQSNDTISEKVGQKKNISITPARVVLPGNNPRPYSAEDLARSQHAYLSPLLNGRRPSDFSPRWSPQGNSLRDHFEKHSTKGDIPTHIRTHSQLEIFAINFWKKEIVYDKQGNPNLMEKSSPQGRLYRFEPSTGVLAVVSRNPKQSGPALIIRTLFIPRFSAGKPHAQVCRDGQDYFDSI